MIWINIDNDVAGTNLAKVTLLPKAPLTSVTATITNTLTLTKGRIITGVNEVFVNNTSQTAIVGTFGANKSNFIQGNLRRAMPSGTSASLRTYKFPIGTDPASGEGFNLVDIELPANTGTTPGGTLLGRFVDYVGPTAGVNYPNFNFFQALTNCNYSPYNGPTNVQWIELDQMVKDFGIWKFTPSNNSGWNYNFVAYPNPANIPANFSPYVNLKIVKAPDNTPFSSDWSQFVTASGNLCDGVNNVGNVFKDYNQANVNPNNTISARSLSGFSDFGVGGGSTTGLPVELISLRADPINNKFIRVSWSTATEINNAGFEVYKSEDGVNFNYIGWVDGAGNSSTQENYSQDDHDVLANKVYYYRLRQIDFDGKTETTHIVSAMINAEGVFVISEFIPNPADNATSLIITSSDVRDVNVTFYNTLGQLISSNSLVIQKGENRFDFNLSDFAAGTYHSLITAGEHNFNKKIIVTR
jgi:hypothetical protein